MIEKNATETTTVSTRITRLTYRALLNFLKHNAHINMADYLRDLIRQDLERHGVRIIDETVNRATRQQDQKMRKVG